MLIDRPEWAWGSFLSLAIHFDSAKYEEVGHRRSYPVAFLPPKYSRYIHTYPETIHKVDA